MIYNVEFQSGKRCTVHNAANPIDAMNKAQAIVNLPVQMPRPVAMYHLAMDAEKYYYKNGFLHCKAKDTAVKAEPVKEVLVNEQVIVVIH